MENLSMLKLPRSLFALALVLVLAPSVALAQLQPGNNAPVFSQVTNAGSTGTTQNKLAKLTGAPSTAVITATTDTGGAAGIVIGGAGTSGNALIAFGGQASCVFDGATTAGDYATISSSVAGDCHDAGASYPSAVQVIGRVLSTNGSGGTYAVALNSEVRAPQYGATSTATSTIGCQAGSLTGGTTATWRYWNFGKVVYFNVSGTPTYTSCTTALTITLPNSWTGQNYSQGSAGSNAANGSLLAGTVFANQTGMLVAKYDGTFPLSASGQSFNINGTLEIQ